FAGSAARPLPAMPVKAAEVSAAVPRNVPAAPLGNDNLEVTFAPDPKLFDGRHANNPWLLELPDLMTKLVWDNAALLSPVTAKALGVQSGDLVTLARDGVGSIEVAAWVMPGQADNSIALTLGWGRAIGRYANSGLDVVGASDVNPLGAKTKPAGFDT